MDGCGKPALKQLAKSLGLHGRVHLPGFISIENGLPDIYRLASLFVTASEIETQGIVLLEAAASGLPIVAVNATCISEIVHNNVNGFLVEPGDVTALDHAIASLLNHPNRACIMGRKGRMLVEGHGIQNTWALHESLYKDMSKQVGKRRMTKTLRHSNQLETMKSLLGLK